MKIIPFLALIATPIAIFTACDRNRVFENYESISNLKWDYDDKITFKVEITDTASLYNIYVNVRHATTYLYSNMFIFVTTTLPSEESTKKRVELPLAEKNGKWYGQCTGDVCDIQIPIQMNAIFPEAGTYTFTIEHTMRQNPLPMVMGVGLRVERIDY